MEKLTEMSVFAEVARCGSFSAAARQLQQSPSAVSKLITRLEKRLGARLFNRSTRQVSLTEGGEVYLRRCLTILEDIEDAEEVLVGYGREPKGRLTINSTAGFAKHCLLPLLPQFQQLYPHLSIDLQVSGDTIDLVAKGVDVAVRMGDLDDTSLVARKLRESPRIICASPSYLEKYGIPQCAADLRQHNCLRLSTAPVFNKWVLTDSGGRQVVDVSGDFITDKVDVLHMHALQGGGLVRLAKFVVEEDIDAGRLVPVLVDSNQEVQGVHAVYVHRQHLPSKIRVFVDFLLQNLP